MGFLTDTFRAYSDHRRLERCVELSGKPSRTPEEDALLLELKSDPGVAKLIP